MELPYLDDEEKLLQTLFVSGQNREMWFLTKARTRVSDYFIESTYKVPGNF